MRLSLQRASRLPRWPWWAVLVVTGWACLVGVGVRMQHVWGVHVEMCMFKRITGLPCPTCGATRGVLAILGGRPLEGFLFNPLLFAVLAAMAAYMLFRLATGKAIRLEASKRERLVLAGLFIAMLVLNWACLVVRGI